MKEKHGDAFDTPTLCLWARMLCSNLREDLDHLPNIPAFNGRNLQTSRRQKSLHMLCVMLQLHLPILSAVDHPKSPIRHAPTAISPSKSVELMKTFQQLQHLRICPMYSIRVRIH